MLSLTACIVVGLGAWVTGRSEAFAVLAIGLAVASMSVLINWIVAGHRWLGLQALLRLPLYLLWKIPIYLRIVKGEEIVWTRTERAPDIKDENLD
jgi:hypothetical protein